MSTSVWGGSEPFFDELYPSSLLKYLLKEMMLAFSAQGACIALLDESIGQMRIQEHVRLRSSFSSPPSSGPLRLPRSRTTLQLENGSAQATSSRSSRERTLGLNLDDVKSISPEQSELFAIGSTFPIGHDLIGYTWLKDDAYVMRHDEYLNATFLPDGPRSIQTDVIPSSYLSVPIQEPHLVDELLGHKHNPNVLGVIVLYQLNLGIINAGFLQRQRVDALKFVERIALQLQNFKLQQSQRRTSKYLQQLQEISIAFPTSVKLSDLVQNIHKFVAQVVDASSMLLTLYDRDMERIFDIFALCNGNRVAGLSEQPAVGDKESRPLWWQIAQREKRSLQFSPVQAPELAREYRELLSGVWGDQQKAESFLLLPLKMYNRVIGTLSLASSHPNAYHLQEIQVLETMLQIVTVSIENAKLYERDRLLLQEAKQREAQLAAINSALQSIGSSLNVSELLNNLVKSVAALVNVDMCVFFQLSQAKEELVAHAIYAPTIVRQVDDGSDLPALAPPRNQKAHEELITMVRFPFKGTILEQLVGEGFFYLDAAKLDELAQKGGEGGVIFLQETRVQQMLMIPMSYQTEFVGILGVPTPKESRFFRPKDIGSLLAICAQATSAVRNAQLFEEREEAYAELQRADKMKDEFLVTASHELRTPLSAISGYSSLLRRQSARISPQQILRFASKIAGAAQQLTDIVTNMTEAAKIGAQDKKLELQIEPVQVYSAAEISLNMLSMMCEQKITIDVAHDLWVKGDALHFRQVMTNLLENATKYSPHESQVYLSATTMSLLDAAKLLPDDQFDHALLEQNDPPVVLVRVRDEGEGVLPADQHRIFEKFVRAPRSLTTPVRGSGLGLYICRRYVEAMGGKLWLEQSTPNEGSIFSFYLPRVDQPIEVREQEIGDKAV